MPAAASDPTAPREVRLLSRPVGWPTAENFELTESDIPALSDGQIRVRNVVMSVDPYMRGRMSAAKSYAAPYSLGEAMTGAAVGVVEESRADGFAPGSTSCTASAGERWPSSTAPPPGSSTRTPLPRRPTSAYWG